MNSYLRFEISNLVNEIGHPEILDGIITNYNNHPDIKDLVMVNEGSLFPHIASSLSKRKVIRESVKLPTVLLDKDPYDYSYVMENWMELLAELRLFLGESKWLVTIDGTEFPWSDPENQFVKPKI